jgi:hydrogenase expression/formation protein HypC
LGIPGKVTEVFDRNGLRMGKVEFGGIVKEACLTYTPEAQVGDYVIVHVGFAISQVDEAEAEEIFSYLRQMEPETIEQPPGNPGAAEDNGGTR